MTSADYAPPQTPLDILHEDDHLLVVNKPSGLLSVPGKGPDLADCLMARILAVYPMALLVHRLDRDTSGVMVFALTAHAQRHLGLQFEKRQTKKTYTARVAGQLSEDRGTVDLPLCVDWSNRPRQQVDHVNGKPAQTDWRVLRRIPGDVTQTATPQPQPDLAPSGDGPVRSGQPGQDARPNDLTGETRLRLMPRTGRSHQLRVHCLALGHPILGDPFYHPTPQDHPRLMLHSTELRLRHPDGGRGMRFASKPPF